MASMKRIKTSYPGVFYILGKSRATGRSEKIYYIRYWINGKQVEEKAGRQFQDDMTPARAATKRAQRIEGSLSNKAKRKAKEAKTAKWTIGRLWDEYLTQKAEKPSLKQDKNRYKLYLKKPFGKKEPEKLIHLDIDRLRIKLLKTKSPQTVKHILSLLRRLINFGAKKGLCALPSFKIEMPEVNNQTTEDLTAAQLKRLIGVIQKDTHPQAGDMMLLALYSGMRRGEMFRLKWADIDFRRGFITLRSPKGGVDQKIPMNDASRTLLKSMDRISKFVFPGRDGKQRTDINKHVNAIKISAKLPKNFRPLHGLRHTYASMLASSGQVDLYTLQRLLTHKSPVMTQRYAHLRDDALKQAANVAGEIINKVVKEDKIVTLKNKKRN